MDFIPKIDWKGNYGRNDIRTLKFKAHR
jgi:hypothetical protein